MQFIFREIAAGDEARFNKLYTRFRYRMAIVLAFGEGRILNWLSWKNRMPHDMVTQTPSSVRRVAVYDASGTPDSGHIAGTPDSPGTPVPVEVESSSDGGSESGAGSDSDEESSSDSGSSSDGESMHDLVGMAESGDTSSSGDYANDPGIRAMAKAFGIPCSQESESDTGGGFSPSPNVDTGGGSSPSPNISPAASDADGGSRGGVVSVYNLRPRVEGRFRPPRVVGASV
jgi:hypothetical protein